MTILYSQPLRRNRKPMYEIGDGIRISKYDLLLRNGYKLQFTSEVFEKIAISPKNLPATQKRMKSMRVTSVICIQKNCSQSFTNGIIYNSVRFKSISPTNSRQYSQVLYKNFTGLIDSGRLQFQKYPITQGTKMSQSKNSRFLMKNFQIILNFTIWNPVFTLPLRKLLKPRRLSFKKNTITSNAVSFLECLEEH